MPDNTMDDREKLNRLLARSSRVLFKASAVWPFDMFPDDISIDEGKVNIVQREFFASEIVHSMPLKSIRDVALEMGPFFATLRVVPDGYPQKEVVIKYLKRSDAICARRIIQGLIVVTKENVDLTKIGDSDIAKCVEEIGTAKQAE